MLGNQFGEATSEVLREWNLEVKFIWVPNSKICASSKHWSTTSIMKNCMNFREKFGIKIKVFIFFFCVFSPVPHILTLGIWKCLFLLQKIREVILRCISPKQRGDLPRLVLQLIHKNAFLKLVAGLPWARDHLHPWASVGRGYLFSVRVNPPHPFPAETTFAQLLKSLGENQHGSLRTRASAEGTMECLQATQHSLRSLKEPQR